MVHGNMAMYVVFRRECKVEAAATAAEWWWWWCWWLVVIRKSSHSDRHADRAFAPSTPASSSPPSQR